MLDISQRLLAQPLGKNILASQMNFHIVHVDRPRVYGRTALVLVSDHLLSPGIPFIDPTGVISTD